MKHEPGTNQVPASALRLSVGEFELGDNGEGSKSAPFRMVARSGQPIDHWYWGRVVHDLSGMRSKGRIPIDYAHDEREVIGYANRFDSESGDLVVGGALVPFKDSDRATEIIHKSRNGVPYEASINFGGDGIKLEQVGDGRTVQVNGYAFAGPGVVVREWPLRGIAVCPYGADGNTSTQLAQDNQVTIEIMEALEMPADKVEPAVNDTNQVVAEVVEVQSDQTSVEANQTPVLDTPAETGQSVVDAATTALATRASEGQRFLESFGDKGGVWFAQGISYADAQAKFTAELLAENALLKQRLSAKGPDGETEPVKFSQSTSLKPKQPLIRLSGKGKA